MSDKGVGVAYRPYGIELISGQLTDLCDCHDALLAVKCQLNSRAMICAVNLVAEGRLQKTILCTSQVIKSRHRLLVIYSLKPLQRRAVRLHNGQQ